MRMLFSVLLVVALVGSASRAQESAAPRMRIAGGVMAGARLGGDTPQYPAEARQKGVSGTVHILAVIDKLGKMENVSVLDGPELLRQAAVTAVSTWSYRPYLLNGMPTEVDTTITVNFQLGGSASPRADADPDDLAPGLDAFDSAQSASKVPLKSVRIASDVLAQTKLGGSRPFYPQEAKQQHVTGKVIMMVVIGPDGHVDKVEPISGPAVLRDAAVEAVGTWFYKPYLVNGEAMTVNSTVTVTYEMR